MKKIKTSLDDDEGIRILKMARSCRKNSRFTPTFFALAAAAPPSSRNVLASSTRCSADGPSPAEERFFSKMGGCTLKSFQCSSNVFLDVSLMLTREMRCRWGTRRS